MAKFGESSDLEVICRLIAPDGRVFVDMGCGAGALARGLAAKGASVHAIEPDPIQAAHNRASPAPNLTFHEARAEVSPLASASVDAVLFCRSLHHVPPAAMTAALDEAARVLRPEGALLVIEPDMSGTWSQLLKPFHDETEVRRLALEALDRHAAPAYEAADEHWYDNTLTFDDFDAFLVQQTAVTFRHVDPDLIDSQEVRERFAAGQVDGTHRFHQPLRVRLYQRPRPAPNARDGVSV